MTAEYFDMCRKEIDAMRVRDPQGRRRSNAGHGWQSNDGIDDNPIFNKLMREIRRVVAHELMPYLGAVPGTAECKMHNSWANINYTHGWNAPHLHNGCFYSGVFFIHADGDEGDFRAIDTDHKIEFNTEVYDQANNFDNSTDTFTAPVTGKYLLTVQVRLDDIDKDANWINTKIVTSNREYRRFIDPVGFDTNVDHFGHALTVVADMDANDTAHIIVRQSGGSAILDIEPGNPTAQIDTFFSGYLLG